MEEDDGFGLRIRGVAQVEGVTVGTQATDDVGARRSLNGVALRARRDLAVLAHAHAGLLTPDVGPPRTRRGRTDDGTISGEGLLVGRVRGQTQFAMDFLLVGVLEELVQEMIGGDQVDDAFRGKEGNQALLPVIVTPFDLAFGLGRGGVEEFDAVEVEGVAELGEGVGIVGVEEGMVVHVECQGQAVCLKDAGEKVQMGQEGFGRIEACARVEARGVVEDVQEDLFVGTPWQPSVGRGVVLPERAEIAGLPAFDEFGRGFVAGVGSELVLAGPAADAGAAGFEAETAVEFAGDGAVGARRLGGEEFGGQGDRLGRPIRVVIAAGTSRSPGGREAAGAGAQVLGIKFVEAGTGQPQLGGSGAGADLSGAEAVEQMTDERGGKALDQLSLFMGLILTKGDGFIALELTPAGGPARRWKSTTGPAVGQASGGARVASPQSPILR